MKKNLRIVSAAAAALLAVAPVAATAVVSAPTSTVQAAETTLTVKTSKEYSQLYTYNKDTHKFEAGHGALIEGKGTELKVSIKRYRDGSNYVYYAITDGTNKGKFVRQGDLQEVPAAKPTTPAKPVLNGPSEHADSYFKAKDQSELAAKGAYANNGTVYAGNDISTGIHNLGDLRTAIESLVDFGYDNTQGDMATFHKYNHNDWVKFVWEPASATNKAALMSQLRNQGITVADNGVFDPAGKAYDITIWTNAGNRFTVHFQNTGYVDETKPVIIANYTQYNQTNNAKSADYETKYGLLRSNRAWQPVMDGNGYVRPLIVEQRDDGTFQPTEWFGAWNNNKQHARINVTTSGSVDWTKPGLYSISVDAKNAAGKEEKVDVPVIVTAKNGNVMTVINNTNIYSEVNGQMVQANLVNFSETVNPGHQVMVYGSAVTKKLNGQDTQFFRIVSPTANFYIPAKDLKNGVVNTPAAETTKTVTIMHISAIYDKNGVATHDPALRAYDTYSVVSEPVTINGAKFYKLAGKDQYIKVGNVDGTSRSLKHNSYVYKSTGKRANKKTLKKGSSVTTYGKSFMIAGHQMYRIGKNQYVKKANF